MMKRTFALILVTTMSVVFILTTLTGCKKNNNATANGIYDEDITVGEWIGLVNQQFWYSNSDIEPGNDVEDELQFAIDYGIIPEDGHTWELDALLTREIAAVTLAGAVGYENVNSIYVEDLGDSEYQNEILSVLNHGIMGLNSDNCFMPGETVKYVEGSLYLQSAYSFWVNYTYDEPVYDVALQDNVLDFVGITNVSVNNDKELEVDEQAVAEKKQLLDNNHVQFDDDTYTLRMDSAEDLGVTENSIILLPFDYGSMNSHCLEVTDLEKQEDGTYVAQTKDASVEDAFSEYKYGDSVALNLSDSSKCQFYDMNGNPITMEENNNYTAPVALKELPPMITPLTQNSACVTPLMETYDIGEGANKSFKIDVNGLSVKAEIQGNNLTLKTEMGESFTAKEQLQYDNEKTDDTSEDVKHELGVYNELKIENLVCTADDNKDLKNFKMTVKIDYDYSSSLGVTGSLSKEWQLFQLRYMVTPGLDLYLTIKLKLSFDGSLSISIEQKECVKGVSWGMNEGFRPIKNDASPKKTFKLDAEIELTLPIEVGVDFLGGAVNVNFTMTCGIGAATSAKNNLVEFPDEKPQEIICMDVEVYPIVKFSFKIKAAEGTWFEIEKGKEFVIFGKDKDGTPEWLIHLENGKKVECCSMELAEQARIAQDQKDEAESRGVHIGDNFVINTDEVKLIVGESAEIRLNEIPAGYSLLDDVYACYAYVENKDTDSTVISVNNIKSMYQDQVFGDMAYSVSNAFSRVWYVFDGEDVEMNYLYFDDDNSSSIQFTAESPGTVELYYKTKDNKYSARCRIIVITEEEAGNTPLRLSENYISVSPGNTKKLEVTSIPGTLTEADLIWESEDPSVASVDASGNVTGITNGVTTIIVKTKDGEYSYRCTVTVFEGIDNVNAEHYFEKRYFMLQEM